MRVIPLRAVTRTFVILAALLVSCAPRVPPPPVADAGRQCLAALDRLGVVYQPAAVHAAAASCEVDNPVRVSAAAIPWDQSGIVSCGFALTLDQFARDDVTPIAERMFGERVAEMRNFGTYACRTTRDGHESLHAEGKAIDVASFILEDGGVISVARDWRGNDAKGRFLHAVARAACRRFSVVLTPDSDRDHQNHLHLDSGPYRLCGLSRGR